MVITWTPNKKIVENIMETHNFITEKSDDTVQIIAHEPEKPIIPPAKITLTKILLFLLLFIFMGNFIINTYFLLETCAMQNLVWNLGGMPQDTVIQCIGETKIWLPYTLKHLFR